MPQQLANFKAEFFKALAHPIRIRILDCLRDGEKGVNELSEALQIEQANVSQQLAILRVRNIVVGRKSGSNVYYSVSDRTLFKLLDVAKSHFQQSSGRCTGHAAANSCGVIDLEVLFFDLSYADMRRYKCARISRVMLVTRIAEAPRRYARTIHQLSQQLRTD